MGQRSKISLHLCHLWPLLLPGRGAARSWRKETLDGGRKLGHLEDGLGSEPFRQEEQDLRVEAAAAVPVTYHSGENLLKS